MHPLNNHSPTIAKQPQQVEEDHHNVNIKHDRAEDVVIERQRVTAACASTIADEFRVIDQIHRVEEEADAQVQCVERLDVHKHADDGEREEGEVDDEQHRAEELDRDVRPPGVDGKCDRHQSSGAAGGQDNLWVVCSCNRCNHVGLACGEYEQKNVVQRHSAAEAARDHTHASDGAEQTEQREAAMSLSELRNSGRGLHYVDRETGEAQLTGQD